MSMWRFWRNYPATRRKVHRIVQIMNHMMLMMMKSCFLDESLFTYNVYENYTVYRWSSYLCIYLHYINVLYFEYSSFNNDQSNLLSKTDASRPMISSPNRCFPSVNTKYATQPLGKISNLIENFFWNTWDVQLIISNSPYPDNWTISKHNF